MLNRLHTPNDKQNAVGELCNLGKENNKSVSIELRKVLLRQGAKMEIAVRKLLRQKKNHPLTDFNQTRGTTGQYKYGGDDGAINSSRSPGTKRAI